MKKLLVVANWKMNPQSEAEALELFAKTFQAAKNCPEIDIAVAPPFPFLASIAKRWNFRPEGFHGKTNLHLAAQDVFWERAGAYTGEVSPLMEKELGVSYVITGHSERRRLLGETDAMVNKKLRAAFEFGVAPILCIGEDARQSREIPEIVGEELRASAKDIPPLFLESLIIAYEPVWAIGSGTPDSPADMQQAAIFIRKTLAEMYGEGCGQRAQILYGGSVTSQNALAFIEETDGEVGGLLVGKDALSDDFPAILERLARARRGEESRNLS